MEDNFMVQSASCVWNQRVPNVLKTCDNDY